MKNKFYMAALISILSVLLIAMFVVDNKLNVKNKNSLENQYINLDENLFNDDLNSVEVITDNESQFEIIEAEDNDLKLDESNNKDKENNKLEQDKESKKLINAFSIILPVKGEITKRFNNSEVEYDEILDQYKTSNNIVIRTDNQESVKAVSNGKVISIKDSLWGKKITVEHNNGYVTTYDNVVDLLVEENEYLQKGEIIGNNGEIDDKGSYVMFGLKKNNEYINPEEFIR